MPLKIIHCADLHLDTVFSELDEISAKKRREDLRLAFSKIINDCKEKNADLLIISGDLFDSANAFLQTVKFVKEKISEIKDIPVYICAGNHDPKTSDSYYNLEDFGENVHVFDTTMEWIETDRYDIYGISFKESLVRDSLLAEFKVKNPDKVNIMVMHGDFTSDDYNLITKTQLENSGLDYVALGHIHKHEVIKAGKTLAVFPGCPEGRGFDETGKKGYVYAEISKDNSKAELVDIAKRKYHEISVDVSDVLSSSQIAEMLKNEIDEKDLYKIILTGETNAEFEKEVICDNIDAFFVKVYDKTTPKIDLLKESNEFSLKGLFIKKALDELSKNEDKELVNRALKIGLSEIEGR